MFFSKSSQNLLQQYFKRNIQWADHPNKALLFSKFRYKSGNLEITLNNFPEEDMYSLLENGREIGTFNDWPSTWSRP